MIEAISQAMKQEIAKYNLEVLQRYPADHEIDMAMLERFVSPGLQYAWMVGDSHTHSAPLGVHQRLNEIPTYVTRLANNDRFYLLTVDSSHQKFTLKEVDRVAFEELAKTPIHYKMVGVWDGFWLFRNQSRVGTCIVLREGTFEKPMFTIALRPMENTSKLDRAALQEWGQQAVIAKTGSLFVQTQVEWQDEIKLHQTL